MKKIILSAAVAAMAFSTSAMAADKGIDITTNGQAVVWYQTAEDNVIGGTSSLFDQNDAVANVGVQLDLGADLGNNFTFGSQVSYIGSLGLENNLVDNTIVEGASRTRAVSGTADIAQDTANQLMLTKIFIAKKIANTTVKLGRQELPMSLSPLAYSESWNVFKNVFDAAVAINTDIPNTTIVAAYVGNTSGHTLHTMNRMNATVSSDTSKQHSTNGGAYMLTAQTTAIPMATVTATYYNLPHTAEAYWGTIDIASEDLPLGLKIGLQAGALDDKAAGAKTTDAFGAKVSLSPMDKLGVYVAYSDVNNGSIAARNLGTGDKTPLYTQLVLTEDSASLDADAITGGISYNMGDMGTITARYGQVDVGLAGNVAAMEETEMDLIYSVKAGGVNYFAAYVNQEQDFDAAGVATIETDVIRVWARLNF